LLRYYVYKASNGNKKYSRTGKAGGKSLLEHGVHLCLKGLILSEEYAPFRRGHGTTAPLAPGTL
jgi:hypothetical protein